MLRKLPVLCILMMLLTVASVSAQKSLKKANKQFDLRAYDLAVQNYQKTLQSNPENADAIIGLAESYRLMKDHLASIQWYEKAIEMREDIDPKYLLRYAHTLKAVGLYDKAQNIYLEYRQTDPELGEHFSQSCDMAKTILEGPEKYEIFLFGANSASSDFGMTFFKDKIVYASFGNVGVKSDGIKTFSHIQKSGNQLMIAPSWQEANPKNVKTLRSALREQNSIGPLSYSREGKVVAYTRNNFSNGYHQIFPDETDLSIYTALVDENGDFYEEMAFPHNETEYATAFAQLAFDGKAMYFASNRPGGFGGFDIYVSYFKKGNWTLPENLGDRINSKGNEITPFFDGKSLYFSSDFHHGLGGFDVFQTEVVAGQWAYPENIGKGANSPGDDYYFTKNMNTGEMYLSSNRIGGRGADDIYMLHEIQNFDFADFEISKNELEEPIVPKVVTIANMDEFEEEELSDEFETMLEEAFLEEVGMSEEINEEETSLISSDVVASKEDFSLAEKVVASYNAEVNLMGARRVSINSVVNLANNATVYFVQVAALSRRKPDLKKYASLVKYGNLYKFYKANSTKIRVGYYFEKEEATEILSQVRNMGFTDAFITPTILNPAEMELVASSYDLDYIPEPSEPVVKDVRPISKYKVRLASYADPLWFDVESVKDMGEVEQWTKGSWTIFVLGGYATKSDAEKALKKAVVRGFTDAQLVMDNAGVLTRVN